MPLAIPDVNPKHVAVTFVNNSTGAALTGCTAPTLGSCTYALTGPTELRDPQRMDRVAVVHDAGRGHERWYACLDRSRQR